MDIRFLYDYPCFESENDVSDASKDVASRLLPRNLGAVYNGCGASGQLGVGGEEVSRKLSGGFQIFSAHTHILKSRASRHFGQFDKQRCIRMKQVLPPACNADHAVTSTRVRTNEPIVSDTRNLVDFIRLCTPPKLTCPFDSA